MSRQIEYSKRQAAGMARATSGRSRKFADKTKYDRKRSKQERFINE